MIVVVSMHILTINNDKTQVQFVQTCHAMSIYTDTCMGVCLLMLAGIKVDQAI